MQGYLELHQHPKVLLELLFGPVLPVHYRLDGPGAWTDAEKTLKKTVSNNVNVSPLINVKLAIE